MVATAKANMPTPRNINLENLKPVLRNVQLSREGDILEFTTAESGKFTHFKPDAEVYLHYFSHGMSVHEIVQHENANLRRMNFILLKEIFSQLYWNDHLSNKLEYQKAIEEAEGPPAFDGVVADPLVEVNLDESTNPVIFFIPILLSAMAVKLFLLKETFSFFILFFPQVFLTAKGLLSFAASKLLFQKQEAMSLHFSLFGIYYKLSAGKRTAIGSAQFCAHLFILLVLSVLSLIYFHHSTDLIFHKFGSLAVLLMLILNLSPIHNSDLSNLNFQIQNNKKRRLGLNSQENTQEKVDKLIYKVMSSAFNLMAALFSVICIYSTLKLIGQKDLIGLIYQIIFDVAAVALFFDLVDQFEKLFPAQKNQSRYWVSQFKASLKKYQSTKDLSLLIRAIPIFDGLSEEVFSQMVQTSKVITLGAGSRVCKDGDLSTDLYVVVEGKVGIYKENKKVIDINEGSLFGEGGFLLGRPRNGSAYCQTKTVLLVIKKPKAFVATNRTQEKNLSRFQKKIWSFQALSQSQFFKDLPSEALMQLINHGEVVELPENVSVIEQGGVSDSLWVIIQGRCQASIDGKKIREMNAKDVFGEIGIIWNSPRTSSVATLQPSVFLKIQAHHVWDLLSQNLNIAVSLQNLGEYRLREPMTERLSKPLL